MNLRVTRGDSFAYDFTLTYEDSGDPVGLGTDVSEIWFTVKNSLNAPDTAKVFQYTRTAGGIQHIDAVNGKGRVLGAPADTAALSPNRGYFWDLQVKLANGNIRTPVGLKGNLSVDPDVTRAIA